MKLSMMLNYAGGFHAAVDKVVELEKAGLDVVWVAEAYSADASVRSVILRPRPKGSRSERASSTSTAGQRP